MYKTKHRVVSLAADFLIIALIICLTICIIPPVVKDKAYSPFFTWVTSTVLIISVLFVLKKLRVSIDTNLKNKMLLSGETALLSRFLERLKFCYSYDEFYQIIGEILEVEGDCSVLYIDRKKNYVLYNSPDRLTCTKNTMLTLQLNFDADWKDGFYFLGGNYGVVRDQRKARGFFMVNKGKHLYVFCRYTRLFDDSVFAPVYDEYCNFMKRTFTINNLADIASLSQEWQQLANTQRSFLPAVMPQIDKLEIAAYFRPLINVSGDYYSVLPISKTKTLLMLGDVSGKGLAAALVMGLVINTIKILEDKDDLPGMIRAVDKAIKGMHLQDKYTVLFLGIVDTLNMTIRYVNASMSDPVIITKAADGYRVKPLTSNCSVVGIIDLPDTIEVSEQRLFRGDVILMASDGVSEVMDDNGVELGNTQLYQDTLTTSAEKSPKEFVDDVVHLVLSYNGNKKLHDDVTMMVAKIVR
ncbi:MAG: SpoIIE family protein phosphatase [Treponema sp.]|jgi:serine phosphatase RsbU (regulator of sigma subunit)|nr:SpoIIE family protein phosphatase [Treponema sp.]